MRRSVRLRRSYFADCLRFVVDTQRGVTAGFKLQRQFLAAGFHDAALGQHVDGVGDDFAQQRW